MSALLEPGEVVEEIRRRPSDDVLRVFWVQVWWQSREDFAADLAAANDNPDRVLVPWTLRKPNLFMDANAVMFDVLEVLEDARAALAHPAASGIDLVLLTRRELAVVDASSPIELPNWYPVSRARGETVTTTVQELTWEVAISLGDEALLLEDVSRLLYDLDVALLARLGGALARSKRKVQSVEALLFSGKGLDQDLARIEAALNQARASKERFRPSTRPGRDHSIVAKLWRVVNQTAPEGLVKYSSALAQALEPRHAAGDGQPVAASLVSVLSRTSNPIEDDADRWCFNLMVTVRSACQLLAAAAHAEEYPRFPVVLLKSVSQDLRRFLDNAVATLEAPR